MTKLFKSQRGISLIETLIGSSLMIVGAVALLPLGILSTSMTENEGHLSARTTEYAQDKMEQLLALPYGDSTTDTTVFPAAAAGGTGLNVGGSTDPANPVAGYVDYLDGSGNLIASPNNVPPPGWMYVRLWQVSSPSANLKQITVKSIVAVKLGTTGRMPQSVVATLKSFPF